MKKPTMYQFCALLIILKAAVLKAYPIASAKTINLQEKRSLSNEAAAVPESGIASGLLETAKAGYGNNHGRAQRDLLGLIAKVLGIDKGKNKNREKDEMNWNSAFGQNGANRNRIRGSTLDNALTNASIL